MFSIAVIGLGLLCNALGTPILQVPVAKGKIGHVAETSSKRPEVPRVIEIFDNSIDELPNITKTNGQNTQLVYIKSVFGPYTYTVVPVPRLRSLSGSRPAFFWSGSSPIPAPAVNKTEKPVLSPVAFPMPISKKPKPSS